jgi:hypothetical protein
MKTSTQMSFVALSIIAKTWMQPKCPSVDGLAVAHPDEGIAFSD